MPKCVKCQKPLVSIGSKRANGKNHNDWDTRRLHKKCFKEFTSEWIGYLHYHYDSYEDTKKAYRSMLETFETIEEMDEWLESLDDVEWQIGVLYERYENNPEMLAVM